MNRVEKLRELCYFVHLIINYETNGDEELADRVLNRYKKDREIVCIRKRVLHRCRTEIWELNSSRYCNWEVVHSLTQPGKDWKPISYPMIAMILGGNHSTWVKMAAQMKGQNVAAF